MTALCGGGTSSPKAGVVDNLVYTTGAAQLLALVPQLRWLGALSPVLGVLAYKVPDLCATDPPGFPTFTTGEVLAFATNAFNSDYFSFLGKAKDAVDTIAWYQLCKCDVGVQPAQPTPPPQPAGTNVTNAPAPAQAACHYQHRTSDVASGTFQYESWLYRLTQPGLTSLRVTIHQDPPAGGNPPIVWEIRMTGDSSSPIIRSIFPPAALDIQTLITIQPGETEIRLQGQAAYTQPMGAMTITIEGFCNGALPGPPIGATPCVTDPNLQAEIDAILRMVTLIQRQHVPFAYVSKTTHAGLSGAGELAVQGILGLSVTLTTVPSRAGLLLGHPDRFYDVGRVTLGTADGWLVPQSIEHQQHLIAPVAGDVTRVGYSFPADVVATIVELVREP